mmetsp:Transcript_989/g.2048  ORF Transcript_989/g.2048 Transcript_989/m.2048 type:complete len:92 (-) Transcript_989:479-754(-)
MVEHNTDTHWFCSNGCPNWNWRNVWDNYTIEDSYTTHTLHIQLYDKDLIGSDDLIGEATIDFTEVAKFCYEENIQQGAQLRKPDGPEDTTN